MKRWYVATTKHQQEIRAAGELRDLEFRIYLPKRHRQEVIAGRRLDVVTGLRFPGYIFIEFDISLQQHGPINNCRCVGELIPPGENPVPLPFDWKDEMDRHIDEEFEKVTGKAKPDPRADLHHGDIVQIDLKDHAFHGREGEYSRTENGMGVVQVGWAAVKVPEIHLKLIEAWKAKAA